MYSNTGSLPCIHKGHLVPARTYSFTDNQIKSTFTYTNAVPQYASFNSGEWSDWEANIRAYAVNTCSARKGDLYLLTGTSDIRITSTDPWPDNWKIGSVKTMLEDPKIVIPNSLWTAGCCVSDQGKKHFALIGNNVPVKKDMLTTLLSLEHLQKLLGKNQHQIKLFPGGC